MRAPRRLLAALGLLLAAPAAHAQLPSIGAAAGLNFASLGDAAGASLGSSTGFHIGAYADLGLGPVAVRPGVFFVRAGRVEGNGSGAASWVAIPVDLRLSTGTPLVRPYALIGPEARIPTANVFGDGTRSFALAANVGVGVELGGLLLPNAFGEVRYGLDLSGLRDDPAVDASVKVNLVMLRVGVGL